MSVAIITSTTGETWWRGDRLIGVINIGVGDTFARRAAYAQTLVVVVIVVPWTQ